MNKDHGSNAATLREAFLELSTARQIPDAQLLDDVIRRYPHFSDELTEFAVALAVDALQGDVETLAAEEAIDTNAVSPAVSRAMSHFQNRLFSVTGGVTSARAASAAGAVPAANPFQGLSRQQFRSLAERMDANIVFVGKLRDRDIDPSTMTAGFQRRVASELNAPLELVIAHFSAERSLSARQFHKADDKPTLGARQTFEEAVKSSGLSGEQQKALLNL